MDLIVIADDLGYYPERDHAIFNCFQNGVIRGSSLLINGFSAKEAAIKAKELGLEIGLHINLTEGYPISDPSQIPSLLKSYEDSSTHQIKSVFLGKEGFRTAIEKNQIHLDEVLIESKAQIELFIDYYGKVPVYIDSHQHIHMLPQLTELFASLFESYQVHYTRIIEDNEEESGYIEHNSRFYTHVQNFHQGQQARVVYENHHIFCPIGIGVSLGGSNMSIQRIINILFRYPREKNQHLVFEMMTHPSVPLDKINKNTGCGIGADDFSQSPDRVHEYNILIDPYLLSLCTEKNIRLCSYSQSHLGIKDCCINRFLILLDIYIDPYPKSSTPRIVLIASIKESTGNTITCNRIYNYLLELNYSVFILDVHSLTHDALKSILNRWNPDFILAIHAYRSGQFLLSPDIQIPFLLILGGTDINVAIHSESKKEVIKNVFIKSKGIICFTESMKNKLDQFCKEMFITNLPPFYVIPQFCPNEIETDSNSNSKRYDLYHRFHIPKEDILLVLPSGLRPVKNITFLFESLSEYDKRLYNKEKRHVYMVIIGPVLDIEYTKEVFKLIPNENIYISGKEEKEYLSLEKNTILYSNIYYHQPLDHHSFLLCLSSSFACLNSSDSEGQAAIVKECWLAGVPIIARDNEGNKYTITSSYNGLLFHTPEECCQYLDRLIHDSEYYNTLIQNAKKSLLDQSQENHEKEQYHKIIQSLL